MFSLPDYLLEFANRCYNLPRRHRHRRLRPACLPWQRRAEQTKTVLR